MSFLRSAAVLALTTTGAAALVESEFMQGFPPAAEDIVTIENFMMPPWNRWGLQHAREVAPTRDVYRGDGPVSLLEEAPLPLDELEFELYDGRIIDLDTWLEESKTDSFLVLHKGRIVYERYMNNMVPYRQHMMFSATKSFIGTMTLALIEEGWIDPERTLGSYIPELEGSAFGDATVQQVLDMTTSISFSEDYLDPNADVWKYGYTFGIAGLPPADYAGPRSIYAYLPTLEKGDAEHGDAFHYVTPNTDVLGWLNSRVTGLGPAALIEQRIWRRLGVERDGYFWLGPDGTAMAGGGLNITARDAARFGQMILQQGRYNGEQVLPESVAARILEPGDREVFNKYYQDPWYEHVGYAYHDQWWTFNNPHMAVSAIGVHGQFIYIDPVAEMVIVKQSSHEEAEGESNEVHGPQIWYQIAEYLTAQ